MLTYLAKKIFGTKNARLLKAIRPLIDATNALEPTFLARSDDDLRTFTGQLRLRVARGEPLDALLPEAFAACREAARRALGMRHFDVQLVGGVMLHRGMIAEMRTGEGKTLVATLAAFLNALEGQGVHVVTVNDYLAKRDSEWMGRAYRLLGLSVGTIVHGLTNQERKRQYACDVTYGTNSEFGFDYLRDNMHVSVIECVQRDLHYAIVDEVDSILIDEARTPLIISGVAEASTELYQEIDALIPRLAKDVDYVVDEKAFNVVLTEAGMDTVEALLRPMLAGNPPSDSNDEAYRNVLGEVGIEGVGRDNLYHPANSVYLHHVTQALRAHALYRRDVRYLVEAAKVVIVDEFTGRKMEGRRWSDGLHQAIEAKERVPIQDENQTQATISYQNFFRQYRRLAGMTGTADTEAEEFHKIYKLEVAVVPTNRPMVRRDADDVVYKNERGKFRAVIAEIRDCHERGQPVLVGTASVDKSAVVSALLQREGIAHEVLNAKHHEREAMIVAQAGRRGAVTIATNMAGRGTDIILGGNVELTAPDPAAPKEELERHAAADRARILEEGGLHVVGTERHESRRIDNQLRGRAGRQGDPGSSRFFLSLEDDLMRIFAADRITGLMEMLGMEEDVPIEHGLINRAIENAQKKVEAHNFDIRKNLLEYDDVMNQQRQTVYSMRRQVLEGRYLRPALAPDGKERPAQAVMERSGPHTVLSLTPSVRAGLADLARPMLDPAHGDEREQRVRSAVYRRYGLYLGASTFTEDLEAALDAAAAAVALSLIEQRERLLDLGRRQIDSLIVSYCPEEVRPERWKLDELQRSFEACFGTELALGAVVDRAAVLDAATFAFDRLFDVRESQLSLPYFASLGRYYLIEEIDQRWVEHLKGMEILRDGIGLRGYGQRDPKLEYRKEGYVLFRLMMAQVERNACEKLFRDTAAAAGEQPMQAPSRW